MASRTDKGAKAPDAQVPAPDGGKLPIKVALLSCVLCPGFMRAKGGSEDPVRLSSAVSDRCRPAVGKTPTVTSGVDLLTAHSF